MSHLQREIEEQPDVIARLLSEQSEQAQTIARAIREANPAYICIAARGTSDNAARYAQYLFGIKAKKVVALATPSIHTLYQTAPDLSRALVIGISQSGQSEDIRQVLTDAKAQGSLTISLTNKPESPLAQQADYHFDLMAGEEVSVAATKSYTAQLTAIAMIGAHLVGDADMHTALATLPAAARDTIAAAGDTAQWIERYRYTDRLAVIGRGYNYCTAFEISLKIKELCYISADGWSEADFRHGPIAIVQPGFPVFVVAPRGATSEHAIDLLALLAKRKAESLVITNDDIPEGLARRVLKIPASLPEWLTPITAVIPGQIAAMHLAAARDLPLDKPRGLSKVTNTQ